MQLRVPDASLGPQEVYYSAQNGPSHRQRPPHLADTGVYACCHSLSQKPCPSDRLKCLMLWGQFVQFALPGIR
jgi:hypothetical protein